MCKVVHYCQVTAVLGTSYTLIAISFDRCLAILFPLKPSLRLTHGKAVVCILLIWILSGFFGFPDLLAYGLVLSVSNNDTGDVFSCEMNNWDSVEAVTGLSVDGYGVLVFALQFWIPLFVLILTYTGIGAVIWRSRSQPGAGESSRALKQQEERRDAAVKMILMMLLVTVLFVICWFPQNILMNYLYPTYTAVSSYTYIYHVWWGCHTFAMSHSFVNPIIYVCRNSRFREGFAFVFRWLPCVRYEVLSSSPTRPSFFFSVASCMLSLALSQPGPCTGFTDEGAGPNFHRRGGG